MKNLLGIVMCGGQSSRMGSDKGLLKTGDNVWAKVVANKLQELELQVVVSVNQGQVANYSNHFTLPELLVDKSCQGVEGPLRGLLSVHQQYSTHDLLLIACDMIDMETVTLQQLVKVYEQEPGFDFYVYQQGQFAEPFGAIYTAAGLAAVMQQLEAGQLLKNSMRYVLDGGRTKRMPLLHQKSFKNYNTL
ncbi:NTP transferase domain-containing protein [Pontibacter qinzhouensis]|uniref:NTP transferase domain-containing protein n=1 Tax=Pontibacter qinzhouensis TaxID=2603253 RepID=A0A5C8K7Q2_9BACT|nr:NTP transferase domain-containing protein [Pontibacter qinzhouensis]TXK48734.1 NTP transferase domain-containing protein [Pontibacter qinzhouensis]